MFNFLKNMFGADDRRRQQSDQERQSARLGIDQPIAGAGAMLSGEHKNSETEQSLKRAAERFGRANDNDR